MLKKCYGGDKKRTEDDISSSIAFLLEKLIFVEDKVSKGKSTLLLDNGLKKGNICLLTLVFFSLWIEAIFA